MVCCGPYRVLFEFTLCKNYKFPTRCRFAGDSDLHMNFTREIISDSNIMGRKYYRKRALVQNRRRKNQTKIHLYFPVIMC